MSKEDIPSYRSIGHKTSKAEELRCYGALNHDIFVFNVEKQKKILCHAFTSENNKNKSCYHFIDQSSARHLSKLESDSAGIVEKKSKTYGNFYCVLLLE